MSTTSHRITCMDLPMQDLRALASCKPYGSRRARRKRNAGAWFLPSAPAMLALAIAACAVASCATAQAAADALTPPSTETLAMAVSATGVQICECREKQDAGTTVRVAYTADYRLQARRVPLEMQ